MSKDLSRYQRQSLFYGIGSEGQEKICKSRVAVFGCGALGTVIANTLARAGVGFLRLIDRDFIEKTNLQRQILFDENDIRENLPKAEAAKRHIWRINSEIEVEAAVADINHTNVEKLISDVDVVMDGGDNFELRFLLNDAAVKLSKPWIYGAAVGSYGLQMTVIPGVTPCLTCVFEEPPPAGMSPTCDTAGVLSPIVNIIASYQCAEALKILSGSCERLHGDLITVDVWENSFFRSKVRRNPECRTCGRGDFTYLSGSIGIGAVSLCGRNAVQLNQRTRQKIDFREIHERLKEITGVMFNKFMMKFEVEGYEVTLFPDGRAIIKGTTDFNIAKVIYSRYIGT